MYNLNSLYKFFLPPEVKVSILLAQSMHLAITHGRNAYKKRPLSREGLFMEILRLLYHWIPENFTLVIILVCFQMPQRHLIS